jgi:hypothetical protein
MDIFAKSCYFHDDALGFALLELTAEAEETRTGIKIF